MSDLEKIQKKFEQRMKNRLGHGKGFRNTSPLKLYTTDDENNKFKLPPKQGSRQWRHY